MQGLKLNKFIYLADTASVNSLISAQEECKQLLKCTNLPIWLLKEITKVSLDGEVLDDAVRQLGDSLDLDFCINSTPRVQKVIAASRNLSFEIQHYLHDKGDIYGTILARNPQTELPILKSILTLYPDNTKILSELWKAENATYDLIIQIIKGTDAVKVLIEIAASHHISEACFRLLADSPNWEVRLRVAKNIRTPKAILLTLTEDTSSKVSLASLQNRVLRTS